MAACKCPQAEGSPPPQFPTNVEELRKAKVDGCEVKKGTPISTQPLGPRTEAQVQAQAQPQPQTPALATPTDAMPSRRGNGAGGSLRHGIGRLFSSGSSGRSSVTTSGGPSGGSSPSASSAELSPRARSLARYLVRSSLRAEKRAEARAEERDGRLSVKLDGQFKAAQDVHRAASNKTSAMTPIYRCAIER